MAALNAWQKLDRVTGSVFGSGSDGPYASATIPAMTVDSCSGSNGTTALTTAGSTFANGDILLIWQVRGTGYGQWEINKVASGGGTTSIVTSENLNYTYTDSGASQAQAVKIPQYTTVTAETGTWTMTAWDENKNGILPIASTGGITVTGDLVGTGKGYEGGSYPQCGEGYVGTHANQQAANGNGGGNGAGDNTGGGGGGLGTAGGNGSGAGSNGVGGLVAGSVDLLSFVFGGGAGTGSPTSTAGFGGAGIMLFAKDVTVTGSINDDGTAGGGGTSGGGGGAAGGSIMIQCATATLGGGLITSDGAAGGTSAGAGGDGRIAVHHSGAVTGTTSPTFIDVTDLTLVEASGFFAIL